MIIDFPTYLIYILLLHTFILLPSICFCVFLYSSSFFFFFFLSQGHIKQKNGSCCPFRPVLAGIGCIGMFRCIGSRFRRNRPVLARIGTNLVESAHFVTYLYSSSIHFFLCLLIFFFLLLFFFFFSLSQGHMKQKNGSCCPFRPVLARIGCIGLFWWPFCLESTVSACFGCIGSHFCRNRPVLARIGSNLVESARIQKKRGELASRTPHRTPVRRPWSRVGAF